ncbi:hypothetical protein FGB62_30g16 [Gracilaria domingensis]|nr:hypothetical protein FGB62_30g16 [Gracilaria domingensis]
MGRRKRRKAARRARARRVRPSLVAVSVADSALPRAGRRCAPRLRGGRLENARRHQPARERELRQVDCGSHASGWRLVHVERRRKCAVCVRIGPAWVVAVSWRAQYGHGTDVDRRSEAAVPLLAMVSADIHVSLTCAPGAVRVNARTHADAAASFERHGNSFATAVGDYGTVSVSTSPVWSTSCSFGNAR